jgi:hypothetical protein
MFNRIVPVLVGSAFVVSIGGLGGTLIWQRMPPVEFKVPDVILCALGLADVESACVQAEIGRIRDEAERIERERDALSLAQEETERRRRELEELNDEVESFNLFSNIETGIGNINTGVEFASILTPEAWVNAWCYWSGPGTGAVSARLDLGRKMPGQPVQWDQASEAQLDQLGITPEGLAEARLGCRFPED